MDIHRATRSFESWLRAQTRLVPRDLRLKHARMRESPFVFLRATFYRWLHRWPTICPSLVDAPRVLAVGDLHVENFGTWRDVEGRLVWGVNDVDEACRLPYTQDLVRLATSARLAIRAQHLSLTTREACDVIVGGYRAALQCAGGPIVLAEHDGWLRRLALNDLRDPVAFWKRLRDLPTATRSVPHRALRILLPDVKRPYRVVRRAAGVGSLGRQRFVALAEWGGALIAREAKALVPSAVRWIDRSAERVDGAAVLARAVRVPDPFWATHGHWIVRRLAPDCTRIELTELPQKRDDRTLLRAMGWETANIHLGSRRAHILSDLKRRRTRWLRDAAVDMADAVTTDWHDWISGRPS